MVVFVCILCLLLDESRQLASHHKAINPL